MIANEVHAEGEARLQQCCMIAIKAVRAAAVTHVSSRQQLASPCSDGERTTVATRADLEARSLATFLISRAAQTLPTAVYSETSVVTIDESGAIVSTIANGHEDDGTWRRPVHDSYWLVDGLDGVVSFRRGLPFFSATVAYVEHVEVQVGATYAAATDELFTVIRGGAPRLNGIPVRASGREQTRGAMVCSGNELRFHPQRPEGLLLRNFGSHALSLAYVACGRIDAYVSVPTRPSHLGAWDCAAGSLLVTAAGGSCLGPAGSPSDIWAGGMVAASSASLAKTLSEVVAFPGGR